MQPAYPDISGILSGKARRRLALAALSWEEKVAIIEQMQKLLRKGLWKDRLANESDPKKRRTAHQANAADT